MLESFDLLASTVALVFQPPLQPPASISGQEMAKFLHMPSPGYSSDGSLAINSHRDQIEVFVSANKVDVRNLSGNFEKGYEKVPEVLYGMCNLLGAHSPTSVGINFVLSVPKEQPQAWIAQRFLSGDLASIFKGSLAGDTISVTYGMDNKVITVRFEARPDSAITVNFNASQEVAALPEQEQIAADIATQWGILNELLEGLDV